MKKLFLLFCLVSFSSFAQKITVSGDIQDTAAKSPLPNALVMAIKLMDSTLVDFTRSDINGYFKLKPLQIDTYQVIITHPKFSDMGYFIFGDKRNMEYHFGKIILQPKHVALEEVTIFAFKDPIYYKGDTLVYTADSFKTKANATVEDLLKKLPGLKVDKDGKITSQGKTVDKVLVDGDEFFGTDPTLATRNLNANSIESVQLYEKKNEDASNSSTGEETQKILNLKLKDEAKKGYFGKVSGASDFQKFYESEVLGNYFKKKLKISVFGLASNTPNSNFNWSDVSSYGLTNEYESFQDNDDSYISYSYNQTQGIPRALKSGIYYNDKLFKNTKLNLNYSYNQHVVHSKTTSNSQYFLTDTSYSSSNSLENSQKKESHSLNLSIEQRIDSLTDMVFSSKIKLLSGLSTSNDITDFLRNDLVKTRNTSINFRDINNSYDITNSIKLSKRFNKRDRLLTLSYNNALSENNADGVLKTDNYSYTDSTNVLKAVNQKKENYGHNQNHNIGTSFTEPITKKIKLETSYDFMYYNSLQNKTSFNNIGGEYTQIDSSLTNHFVNNKQINRAGLKFIYEIKKMRFTIGARARHVYVKNTNYFKQQEITQNFNNVLPFSTLRYKFSDNTTFNLNYTTNSNNPTINQLQPVIDNSNPNFINIGNPTLLPTFSHHFDLNFHSWKSVSGKYTWLGLSYINTTKDITMATHYDTIGRTISQAINIDGNYRINGYIGTSIPFFSKKLNFNPGFDGSYSNNNNLINGLKNTTKALNSTFKLGLSVEFENLSGGADAYYAYNSSESTLNITSNKPYGSQGVSAYLSAKLPKKITLESDANYTINSNRTDGYNINFLVWNASLSKTFLKRDNLIIGIYAFDILNQNISVNRFINSNIITDTKTNIISRYLLLKVTLKLNSNKTKEEEDEY